MCDLCSSARGPRPISVPTDGTGGWWARTYQVIAEGRAVNEAHGREYLERHGLTGLVERLERDGVGLRREPRADGEDNGDG